jgi:aldose 1-epimerase
MSRFRAERPHRPRVLTVALLAAAALLALPSTVLANNRHHKKTGRHHGGPAQVAGVTKQPFGTANGTPVDLYTLNNGRGLVVKITNYGATVTEISTPDRHRNVRNITLGFPTLADYVANTTAASGTTYFGATIGRYANRIGGAQFTLDGVTYHLPANNGPNTLHGGPGGFHTKVWDATAVSTPNGPGVKMTLVSPDGDQGFPGTLNVSVTFAVTPDNALRMDYGATTDKPTVINLTNHAYFNLAGEGTGDVYDQVLKINASHYTPVDSNLIPTGEIAPVAGTPLDFTHPTPIGARIRQSFSQLVIAHGYDHNWVIDRQGSGLEQAAFAWDPATGRTLRVVTTEPGVQFYSGNFLDGSLVGTSGSTYRQGDGFTLETQHFPDSPNKPNFPSTVLRPGQTFSSTTEYQFGVIHGHHRGHWSRRR